MSGLWPGRKHFERTNDKIHSIMVKTIYEAPLTRLIEVRPGGVLLTSTKNVETMSSVTGSWEEDDE